MSVLRPLHPKLASLIATFLGLAAACGGSVVSESGSGSTGSGAASSSGSASASAGGVSADSADCIAYCTVYVACIGSQACTLADPSAVTSACADACQGALDALGASDAGDAVAGWHACLSCEGTLPKSQCAMIINDPACTTACSAPAVSASNDAWWNAFIAAFKITPSTVCPNGMGIFGTSCSGTSGSGGAGGASSCSEACCNGSSCSSPDVAATCAPEGAGSAATCTCTAGKNKGKTFTSTTMCGDDVWTICNL